MQAVASIEAFCAVSSDTRLIAFGSDIKRVGPAQTSRSCSFPSGR